ncbi:hypothetical protein AYO38_07145 [bacterium SCGC AG-212-C10]|nr:hypothetical protein AYO38_07145 [bacterium SCGC AG-212-C10]
MVRLQVSLRPEEEAAVERESRRLGISRSEVVRRALAPLVSLASDDEPGPGANGLELLLAVETFDGGDGPTDDSIDEDHGEWEPNGFEEFLALPTFKGGAPHNVSARHDEFAQ